MASPSRRPPGGSSHVIASAAKRSIARQVGEVDSLRCARNDAGYSFAFSRRWSPEVCIFVWPLFEIRGRREDRVLAAPAVSRAICANKRAHEHTGQLEHSGLPCAMALRLTSCSSRRTAFLPPSPALLIACLAPAPRRPNHTTSPYASGAYVYRALSVHRISPRVRDDGQRPSSAVRQAELCD